MLLMGAQIVDFGFDAAVSTIYRIVESTVHIVHTASFETYYGTLSTVESIIAKSSTKIHPRLAALINTIYYHGINRQNFIWFALIASFLFLVLGTKKVVKWPLFMICSGVVIFDYFIYFCIVRFSIYILESFLVLFTPSQCSLASHQKRNAETYEEWCEAAEKLDSLQRRTPRLEEGYSVTTDAVEGVEADSDSVATLVPKSNRISILGSPETSVLCQHFLQWRQR